MLSDGGKRRMKAEDRNARVWRFQRTYKILKWSKRNPDQSPTAHKPWSTTMLEPRLRALLLKCWHPLWRSATRRNRIMKWRRPPRRERGSYLLALLQQSFLRKASNIPMQLAWGTYAHWQVKKRKRNPVSLRRWTIHLGPPCCGVQVVKHIWLQSSTNIHLSNASHDTPREKYRTRNPRITGLPLSLTLIANPSFTPWSQFVLLIVVKCSCQQLAIVKRGGGREKDYKIRACAH